MKKRNTMFISLAIALGGSFTITNHARQWQQAPVHCEIGEIERFQILSEPREIIINEKGEKFQDRCSMDWSTDDAEILMKLAMAEAEGESTEGKAMVMLVVLNRMLSSEFPNTIKDVVFQSNQFSTVNAGGRYWTTEPDEDCVAALRLIEHGYDESNGALYFESVVGDSWHSKNLEFLFQKGNHKFYR